jgi:Mce-associated membrane protein
MTTLSENTDTTADAAPDEIVDPEVELSAAAEVDEASPDEPDMGEPHRIDWSRILAFGVLPGLALMLALASGYFKWVDDSAGDLAQARTESVRVASEDAVALLSYKADSVDKDLGAARERLTGDFKDAYAALTRQVVIPGAQQKHITAAAKVNAAASVSASAGHAEVLLFVDQTVTIGDGAPTDTQPVVRVTLDKVDGRWLVSHFDPV